MDLFTPRSVSGVVAQEMPASSTRGVSPQESAEADGNAVTGDGILASVGVQYPHEGGMGSAVGSGRLAPPLFI